jgi:hypothetical protein
MVARLPQQVNKVLRLFLLDHAVISLIRSFRGLE